MLTRLNTDAYNTVFMEFKNVKKTMLDWLEVTADEYHCKIEKKEWKSKYNHYVVYDYEPFCSEGFEIIVTVSSKCPHFLNFVRYLYELKIQTINYLEGCMLM